MPEDKPSVAEPGGAVLVEVKVGDAVVPCATGKPLLNALLNAGLVVPTACGGQGVCHLCRVMVQPDAGLPPPTAVEKRALGNVLLAQGMRLSCQINVHAPLTVRLLTVQTSQERRARRRPRRPPQGTKT